MLGVFIIAALFPAGPLPAQSSGGAVLFSSVMQDIEKTVSNTALPAAERHDAMVRLGYLLQLSGNTEDAAETWEGAALSNQAKRDDAALLSAARCRVSMGELEEAESLIRRVLLTGRDAGILLEARYLGAQIEALRPGKADFSPLESFLDDPDFADRRAATLYVLWKLSGNGRYRELLVSQYAGSPEEMALRNESPVSAAATAMWLLFPGRDALELAAVPAVSAPPAKPAAGPAAAQAAPPPAAPTAPSAAPRVTEGNDAPSAAPAASGQSGAGQSASEQGGAPRALQTGLFGREENAEAMVERLKEKGFSPFTTVKTVEGNSYWAVSVPPGNDAVRTAMLLKEAGFESFPVF